MGSLGGESPTSQLSRALRRMGQGPSPMGAAAQQDAHAIISGVHKGGGGLNRHRPIWETRYVLHAMGKHTCVAIRIGEALSDQTHAVGKPCKDQACAVVHRQTCALLGHQLSAATCGQTCALQLRG